MPDFILENHGSIWLVHPQSDAAREHLAENVSDEAQWFGKALVVEPRYVEGLVNGLRDNGWEV
jgi:hypothetical protein